MKAVGPRAFALVVLAGAATACGDDACTTIGCVDEFALTIRHADGRPPSEAVEVSDDMDDVVCPVVSLDQPYASCSETISINLMEELSCTRYGSGGGSDGQTCVSTGRYELLVVVQGKPANVAVTLHDGDTIVAEKTFEPAYKAAQPNGPGCGPTCQQATELWAVPE